MYLVRNSLFFFNYFIPSLPVVWGLSTWVVPSLRSEPVDEGTGYKLVFSRLRPGRLFLKTQTSANHLWRQSLTWVFSPSVGLPPLTGRTCSSKARALTPLLMNSLWRSPIHLTSLLWFGCLDRFLTLCHVAHLCLFAQWVSLHFQCEVNLGPQWRNFLLKNYIWTLLLVSPGTFTSALRLLEP